MGCLISILPLESIQRLFPGLYAVYKEYTSYIFGNVQWVNHVRSCSCLASDMEEKQTELETKSK